MILHVDMDAFYASVEEREFPALRGKPLIVGGSAGGRGVVAAANYAARKFGVHSAMPTSQAIRLCPHVKIIRPRMDFYAGISRAIREIFHRYTPEVEPLSLDEAFLNVAGSEKLFGSAEKIGRMIQHDIATELNLVASVGVAPNKFLAKLASDLEKPNGFTVIPANRIHEILDPLSVSRIWGVGHVTLKRFERYGITTFGQLRKLTVEQAKQLFGSSGEHFWQLCQGIDGRNVVPDREAKAVSHETTFSNDITDLETLEAWLLELTEQVGRRLRRLERKGRTVTIKVRFSDFHTITRSRTLPDVSNSTERLWQTAVDLLRTELPQRDLVVRLLGMGVSQLDQVHSRQAKQLSLFEDESDVRSQQLDATTDLIRASFGAASLRRGSSVKHAAKLNRSPNVDDLK